MRPESLYVHIPFCKSKCRYCDFTSIRYDESIAARYVDALRAELRLKASDKLNTLYIGGGTPTIIPNKSIKKIFSSVSEFAELSKDAEVTCEANPGSIDEEKITTLLDSGVNRLSIGVQSFDHDLLEFLGRSHTTEDARAALTLAKSSGLTFSLDLMYGIPGQNLSMFKDSLEEALSFSPHHLSAYELTPEEGTPLMDSIALRKTSMPHEEEVLEMFHECRSILAKAGFEHYEVSNFAKPGKQSRHNNNYWRRGEYIGVGAGAHSFTGEQRYSNTKFVFEYLRLLGDGLIPVEESTVLTDEEAKREYVFLGMRLLEGLSKTEAKERFDIDLNSPTFKLKDQGLIFEEGDRLRLTERGLELSNTAVAALLDVLEL